MIFFLCEEEDVMDNKNIPYEYKPISMWGYFGYELLFSIPFRKVLNSITFLSSTFTI